LGVAPADRPRVTLEVLRLLATLKLNPARQALIGTFMKTYLRLNAEEQQQYHRELTTLDSREREAVMHVMTIWEEQGFAKGEAAGIARGEAAGIAKGEVLGTRKLLSLQLRPRCGPTAAPLVDRVSALPPTKLDELALAILTFATPADAEAWLAANG
jgi:hypothetical protein